MQNFLMLDALVETDAIVINPNGETFVDLMIKPGLPGVEPSTMNPQSYGSTVYGLVAPGDKPGDELIIRQIPQRRAYHTGPVPPGLTFDFPYSNLDTLILLGIQYHPTSNAAFMGVSDGSGGMFPAPVVAGLKFLPTNYDTVPNNPVYNNPNVDQLIRMIVLRWTGDFWLITSLTQGIVGTPDPVDVAPPIVTEPPVDHFPEA